MNRMLSVALLQLSVVVVVVAVVAVVVVAGFFFFSVRLYFSIY